MSTVSGRVVGFIRPPPEVRGIVDKTASFVAKSGAEFEAKIAEREAGNQKFAFLRPDNPYHSYYKHKVEELASGKAPAPAPASTAAASSAAEALGTVTADVPDTAAPAAAAPPLPPTAEASSVRRVAVANPLNAALKNAKELLAAGTLPERDEFTIPSPSFGGGELIDAMKLTAQARAAVSESGGGGRAVLPEFMPSHSHSAVYGRERPRLPRDPDVARDAQPPLRLPQAQCVGERRPRPPPFPVPHLGPAAAPAAHALFAYFTALVNAYSRILQVRCGCACRGGGCGAPLESPASPPRRSARRPSWSV